METKEKEKKMLTMGLSDYCCQHSPPTPLSSPLPLIITTLLSSPPSPPSSSPCSSPSISPYEQRLIAVVVGAAWLFMGPVMLPSSHYCSGIVVHSLLLMEWCWQVRGTSGGGRRRWWQCRWLWWCELSVVNVATQITSQGSNQILIDEPHIPFWWGGGISSTESHELSQILERRID